MLEFTLQRSHASLARAVYDAYHSVRTLRGITLTPASPEPIAFAHVAPRVRAVQQCFAEFDAVTAAIPDYQGEYLQLERGPIRARMIRAALDRVVAIQVSEDVPAYAFRATAPEHRLTLAFVMGAPPDEQVRWRGLPVSEATLVGYAAGAEHVGRSRGRMTSVSLHFEREALERHAAVLGYELAWAPGSGRSLVPDPRAFERLRQSVGRLLGAAESCEPLLEAAGIRSAYEEAILTSAVLAAGSGREHADRAADSHRRAVRRAVEIVEARADGPVYLAELCQAAGVSERTLRGAFQHIYGVSPIRFLHLHRMRQARRRLLAADPSRERVSEIAARLGFGNLGRFAVEFRRLYGASPSALLRAS